MVIVVVVVVVVVVCYAPSASIGRVAGTTAVPAAYWVAVQTQRHLCSTHFVCNIVAAALRLGYAAVVMMVIGCLVSTSATLIQINLSQSFLIFLESAHFRPKSSKIVQNCPELIKLNQIDLELEKIEED